jgi:hypothetical protein
VIRFVGDLRQFGTPVSSTNKTDRHDITETLLILTLHPGEPFLAISNIYDDPLTNKSVFLNCTLKYRVNAQYSKGQGYGI